ncbi:MAG: hypothetical protein LBB05_01640 [Puniceicoccales bacterium]|nr:hypothetical protein [Puniceicoccales bacterium]
MDTDKAEQIADNFFRRSVALVARNPELINQLADLWIRIVIDALNGEVTIEEATVYRKKTKQRLKKDAGIPCNASLLTSEQKRMCHSLERRFEEVFVQNPAVIQPFLLFIEERLNFSNEEKVQLQLANETLR